MQMLWLAELLRKPQPAEILQRQQHGMQQLTDVYGTVQSIQCNTVGWLSGTWAKGWYKVKIKQSTEVPVS